GEGEGARGAGAAQPHSRPAGHRHRARRAGGTARGRRAKAGDGIAAADGLSLDFDALKVANSRRAHRLIQHAKQADPGGDTAWRLELALFAAHFSDGLDTGDPDTLVGIATSVGLDAGAAREALASEELDALVGADVDEASRLGIRGVPFFVLAGRYGLSGAQQPEVFDQALRQVWDEAVPAAG
ncbi:MAG: DsbA family protein, partial [Actinobacteria bacterium]|nr:DsbA family protein [Actinomycetota bacterium]